MNIRIFVFPLILINILICNAQNREIEKAENLSIQNPEKSIRIAKNIYNTANLTDQDETRVLYLLSYNYALTNKPLEALDFGEIGLIEAVKQCDTLMQLKLLSNLGNVYQSFQFNEKTKEYLDRAEHLLNNSIPLKTGDYLKGNIYYLQAMNYAYSLDSEIALSYFDKAIAQYKNSKKPLAIINLKIAYLSKAFCLINLKRFSEAKQYLTLGNVEVGKTKSNQIFPDGFLKRQEVFVMLGYLKIDTEQNNSQKAISGLLSLLNDENQIRKLNLASTIYELLAENYLEIGDMERSEYYNKIYHNEFLISTNKSIGLQNAFLKKDREKKDNKSNKIILKYIYLGICISFILIISNLFLYYKMIKTNKDINELKKQL